jgi:hypothetical protein
MPAAPNQVKRKAKFVDLAQPKVLVFNAGSYFFN